MQEEETLVDAYFIIKRLELLIDVNYFTYVNNLINIDIHKRRGENLK